MTTERITIESAIDAGIDKVWKYYNEARHIVNWNFASDTWCCPRVESEFNVGGRYVARMEAKDGSMGFDFEATFDEIRKEEKVAYTMGDGRKADVFFKEQNGGTHVNIRFDPDQSHPIEMQRDGWQAILNNFKKYVEAN
jgi:uncharacterized protein YndB with AHSA1/START domain